MPEPGPTSPARLERLIGAAGLACALVVIVATVLHALQLREALHDAAAARVQMLARTLTKELNRTLAQTQRLIDEADDALAGAAAPPPAFAALLESLPRQQTLLREIALLDRSGRVIASSNRATVGQDLSERELMGYPADARLRITRPVVGRSLGRDPGDPADRPAAIEGHLTLSRSSVHGDRSVRIVAVIGTHSLLAQLRFLAGADDAEITVYRYDGRLLAATDPGAAIRPTPHPVFERLLTQRESGGYEDRPNPGEHWLAHFDTAADYPVVVDVRTPGSSVSALWQTELIAPALVLMVTLLTVALFMTMTATGLRDRARSQQQAATQERRLRNILDTAADGIVTVDERDRIREYNRAAQAIFGVPIAQAIGQPVSTLLPIEGQNVRDALARRGLSPVARPESAAAEPAKPVHALRRDGQPMALQLSLSEVTDQGERLLTAIVRDVTEERRREIELRDARDAAQAAAAAKAHFLATMSHELRTPMTGIIGMADLLQDTAMTDEQRRFVEVIRSSARSLLTVLNDTLDFSKIEAGHLELECIAFRPADVAREVTALLSQAASRRGNRLAFHFDDTGGTATTVRGDPTRLRQVLVNLVGNAIKFTERGTITVTGRAERHAEGRVMLDFEVRDTGIGIDPQVLPTLFEPFRQADSSTTRRFGGTGLGLAISRHLVEAMGGRIEAHSDPGRGSTFRFSLLLDAVDPLMTTSPEADTPPASALSALRLLVAEDNPINQLVIGTWLRRGGHQVDVAQTGRQAVEAVRTHDYDAVLMDMQMPELDGADATRAIRRLPEPRNRVPIIALTADALPDARDRHLASGLDDYVTKPIDWAALERALRRCIDRRGIRSPSTNTRPVVVPGRPSTRDAAPTDAQTVGEMRADLGMTIWDKASRIYWPKVDEDLAACRAAMLAGDDATRRRLAHSLKGAAASLGFASVAHRASVLEHCAPSEAPLALRALEQASADARLAWAPGPAAAAG